MGEARFQVYQTPLGAVYIRDTTSAIQDVLYVSYSEVDHEPGPVNALQFASAVVSVLNSGSANNVAAKLECSGDGGHK